MQTTPPSGPHPSLLLPGNTDAAVNPSLEEQANFRAVLEARRQTAHPKTPDTSLTEKSTTKKLETGKTGSKTHKPKDTSEPHTEPGAAAGHTEAWLQKHPDKPDNVLADQALPNKTHLLGTASATAPPNTQLAEPIASIDTAHSATERESAGHSLLGDFNTHKSSGLSTPEKTTRFAAQSAANINTNASRLPVGSRPAETPDRQLKKEKALAPSARATRNTNTVSAPENRSAETRSTLASRHTPFGSEVHQAVLANPWPAKTADFSVTTPAQDALNSSPSATATGLQLPVTASAAPSLLTPITLAASVHSAEWPDHFSQRAGALIRQLDNGSHTATLRLTPPELGQIHIALTLDESAAQAVFSSAHAAVRQAIEQALPQLAQQLAQSGIALGDTSVNDQSNDDAAFGKSPEHNQKTHNAAAKQAGNPLAKHPEGPSRGLIDTWA